MLALLALWKSMNNESKSSIEDANVVNCYMISNRYIIGDGRCIVDCGGNQNDWVSGRHGWKRDSCGNRCSCSRLISFWNRWSAIFELTPFFTWKGSLLWSCCWWRFMVHQEKLSWQESFDFYSKESIWCFWSIFTPKTHTYSTRNKFQWKIFFAWCHW